MFRELIYSSESAMYDKSLAAFICFWSFVFFLNFEASSIFWKIRRTGDRMDAVVPERD